MKKIEKIKKNKLLVANVKSLLPNPIDKTLYLNIIINDSLIFKTKTFDFKKSSIVDFNDIYDLGDTFGIDCIKFQILEKNGVFSNALFKGDFNAHNATLDEHTSSYICFLSNTNLENAAVVYFNYEINSDVLDEFEKDLKTFQHKGDNDNRSAIDNLKELAAGANAEGFSRFVKNMDYVKTAQKFLHDFYYWKSPWKTFGMLIILTLCIKYMMLFYVFTPLLILYFHVINRNQISHYTFKGQKHDHLENMTVITNTIKLTNTVVDWYENCIDALQYSDKSLIEEIWVNLIKLFIWNAIMVTFGLFRLKLISILVLWIVFLYNNPTFHAFAKFLYNFVYIKFFLNLANTETAGKFTNMFYRFVYTCVPFSVIIHKIIKIQNDKLTRSTSKKTLLETLHDISPSTTNISIDFSSITDSLNQGENIRYEIYENERWWMLVGWAKNLIMNERPLWSDISGKHYMDKNSVFLPNNEQYQWISEWQVIATDSTDSNGWEYASDFNSHFGPYHNGKFVRRRKWVRHAKKIK
jgi:hypothetical protein